MEKIKKYKINFTQVSNIVLNDKKISLRAKGVYAYLFSKPDDWIFHINAMENELKESKGQIYSAIRELIDTGYIIRKQINENGKFGGIVYEFVENPYTEIPCTEKPAYVKTYSLNNIDVEIINNNNNKDNIYMQDFAEFWTYYPKQRAGNKDKAYKSYLKVIKEKRATHEQLINSVIAYSKSDEVSRGYAKGCSAWLNDDRFLSDYTTQKQTKAQQTDEKNLEYLKQLWGR